MEKIYIVLTYTGTILSKMIKLHTKHPYSHVSIALDEDLENMYSFGRFKPYNPFFGGFVKEGIDFGTFKRFKNTTTQIYSMDVTEEQYDKITDSIKLMEKEKSKYKFNIIGLALAGVNKKYERKYSLYCAEFVRNVLQNAGVDITALPLIIKPKDFMNLENLELMYEGLLREKRRAKELLKTTV